MVREAEDMLESLASDIAEYGGRPISIEPLPATGSPDEAGASIPASATGSGAAPVSGGGSSAVTPAVRVVPVNPAVTVVPVPAQPAAPAQPSVSPVQPAPPVQPAVSVQPAVHVTPIPVEQPEATADPAEPRGAETKGPDDTSTAAISIVNAKQG
jgi:macrolide phosphotransferase